MEHHGIPGRTGQNRCRGDYRSHNIEKRADKQPTIEGEVAHKTKTQVMAEAGTVGDWIVRRPGIDAGHSEVESPRMLGEGLGVRGVTRMGRFRSPWDHPIQYGTPSRSKGDEYRCSETGEKGVGGT